MNVAQETLGFRRAGLSPALSLLMSAIPLPQPPADLSIHLHRRRERSSTTADAPSSSRKTKPHRPPLNRGNESTRDVTSLRMRSKERQRSAASVIGLSPV